MQSPLQTRIKIPHKNLASSQTAESRDTSRIGPNTNNSGTTSKQSCTTVNTREETGEDVVAVAASDEDMTESAMLEAAIKMSMESVEQKT